MRKLLLILLCLLMSIGAVEAQKPKKKVEKKVPTVVSVADLLPNYGLDSALVSDTSYVMNLLAERPQDYVALTNYCVEVRTKAKANINSIEIEYVH